VTTTILGLSNSYVTGDTLPAASVNALADNLEWVGAGYLALSVAGSSNVALTEAQYEVSVLKLTGVLTGSIEVQVPAHAGRRWVVWNATSGAFTVTVKPSGASGIIVTQGYVAHLFCDGTDVKQCHETVTSVVVRTAILDANGNEELTFIATSSAVNGLRIVNAATGNSPTVTNEGEADTGITFAGYDGSNTEEILELDAVASAVNGWKMAPAASGSVPRLGSNGTGAASNLGWELVDSNGNEILEGAAVAAAVNGLRIVNAATGVMPALTTEGEADTGIILAGYDGSNQEEILILDAVASAVNEVTLTNAATGAYPKFAATGGDTNIHLDLIGKGTGAVRLVGPAASPVAPVQDIATGNTITLPTGGFTKRLSASGGAATGVILTAGTTDGQLLALFNIEATNTITFAAAGTSNVADGTGAIIAALQAMILVWDTTSSRWYRQG
jgi:hypothetical protein